MRRSTENDPPGPPDPSADSDISDGIEIVTRCPLCGSSRLHVLFRASDTLHEMPGEWGVHRCRDCGLMLTSPRPDRATIARYYPSDYQPFGAPHAPPERPRRWSALKKLGRRLLDPKEHVLPPGINPGRALEVGCGSGRYLAQLAASGWHVHGLEPSAETADHLHEATGLPVTVGSIQEACFDPGSFDLVVAVMVLEHLHAPIEDINRIHAWLRPGGFLAGSVPNGGSWEFSFFGPSWYALQVPTHLHHFTPTTLTMLLEKGGFKNIRISHQRNVNNLMIHLGRSLDRHHIPGAQTCLAFPERGPTALRYAVRPIASMLAWLHQAGRISFTAEKT